MEACRIISQKGRGGRLLLINTLSSGYPKTFPLVKSIIQDYFYLINLILRTWPNRLLLVRRAEYHGNETQGINLIC